MTVALGKDESGPGIGRPSEARGIACSHGDGTQGGLCSHGGVLDPGLFRSTLQVVGFFCFLLDF
jgi:hypothetical protein